MHIHASNCCQAPHIPIEPEPHVHHEAHAHAIGHICTAACIHTMPEPIGTEYAATAMVGSPASLHAAEEMLQDSMPRPHKSETKKKKRKRRLGMFGIMALETAA